MADIPTAQLGKFVFALSTASVDTISRNWSFGWKNQDRLGQAPVKIFTGPGDQTLSLSGIIYPGEIGEAKFIERMAIEAGTGNPMMLVTNIKDIGQVLNWWCITGCQETSKNMDGANQARAISFSLNLSYYGDRYGDSTIPDTFGGLPRPNMSTVLSTL